LSQLRFTECCNSWIIMCCRGVNDAHQLTRIQCAAPGNSSLESIVIPSNVGSIDRSAFCGVNLSNCLIESGNRRFVLRNDFLIDLLNHKLMRNLKYLDVDHTKDSIRVILKVMACYASISNAMN
jgi:hypothetical protein